MMFCVSLVIALGVRYLVKTITEPDDSAGTSANVYVNLIGSLGDSGKRCLMHSLDDSPKFVTGAVSKQMDICFHLY